MIGHVAQIRRSIVLGFCCTTLAAADAPPGGETPAAARAASAVPEFVLASTSGERISLYAERPGRVATVLAFLSPDCPVSKLEVKKVAQLAREYEDQGIRFFAVDS